MSGTPWAEIDAQIEAANDYNTTAEAVRDAAVKAFEYAARRCGLTGFQAGWAALSFYGQVMHFDGPFTVFRGEDLLYPQYDLRARLREWIDSDEMRSWLADEADKLLADGSRHAAAHVAAHWRRLSADRPRNVDTDAKAEVHSQQGQS